MLALPPLVQAARREAGLSTERPNIVLSHVAQVCWQKVGREGRLPDVCLRRAARCGQS